MKYNANGGQRRSSKTTFEIPFSTKIQCQICKKIESRLALEKLEHWQIQHMHLEDGELEFMTCPECKTLNPTVMLEKLKMEEMKK